jgi:HEAT repeat protein
VREAAAAALERTWSDDALQPLAVAARSDSSAQVRETAAQALRSTEDDDEAG